CDSACQSCVGSETGGNNGTCAPARADTDPHNDCPQTDSRTCGTDGACDGAGKCRKFGTRTACGAAQSCADGMETPAGHCDGNGKCSADKPLACSPFACGTDGHCLGACQHDPDCAPGLFCNKAGRCVAPQDLGATCTAPGQCKL